MSLGRFITNFAKSRGLDQDMAGTWCSVTLVFISVILLDLIFIPKIGKKFWAGAGGKGAWFPTATGIFAKFRTPPLPLNIKRRVRSLESAARFSPIAGPVILYGIMSSWIAGVIYYLLKIMEVIS